MLILRLLSCLALAGTVAGCGGGQSPRYASRSGHYPAPGSADDPWGPYISEAANRYQVPETWIREVMRQESGGKQYLGGGLTTSSAGAMGLMQVMPATYEGLRQRYGLGDDPYDPHDNIMAGTAYIREMYDRYGAPNFLAAYNAGPRRVDDYLAGASTLPAETVNYVASIGPRLGGSTAGSPRATYAAAAPTSVVVARMEPIASPGDPGVPSGSQLVARMEPIASPGDPGVPVVQTASRMEPVASPGDPGVPPIVEAMARQPLGAPLPAVLARLRVATVPADRSPPPGFLVAPASARTVAAEAPATAYGSAGTYGVQVGAYASAAEARSAAEAARFLAGAGGRPAVGTAPRPDGKVLFRARLVGLSPEQAAGACRRMQVNGKPCFVVPPEGAS